MPTCHHVLPHVSCGCIYPKGGQSGHGSQLSAIHAQLCSLVVLLHILHTTCTTYNVTSGSAQIYNDCSKALKHINSPGRKFKRFLDDDYDLFNEARILLAKLQKCISISLIWIRGHYSGQKRELQHDLNVEAHHQATAFLKGTTYTYINISPPSTLASLHKDITLTSKWWKVIHSAVHSQPLRNTM